MKEIVQKSYAKSLRRRAENAEKRLCRAVNALTAIKNSPVADPCMNEVKRISKNALIEIELMP